MIQYAYLGLAWGLGIWFLWTGYLLVYSPKWFKSFILRHKYRIVMTDLAVTYLGSRIILNTSGSIVSGIGSGTLMIMCFLTSAIIIGSINAKSWCQRLVGRYV